MITFGNLEYLENVFRYPAILNKKAWVFGWLGKIEIFKNSDIHFFKPGDRYRECSVVSLFATVV